MVRISAIIARFRRLLNLIVDSNTPRDAVNQNEPSPEKGEGTPSSLQRGVRTTRAQTWSYLYLTIFENETDISDTSAENWISDTADTAQD